MPTLITGFALISYVVYLSMGSSGAKLYLNAHAAVIVLGGTAAILIMSNSLKSVWNLIKSIFVMLGGEPHLMKYREDLLQLSTNKKLLRKSKSELINYAAELWEQGIDPELFIVLISQRRDELEQRLNSGIHILRNLAKYPPALGMTGTVMGMVSLFSALGQDSKNTIGPALALAMTATFFGLALANFVVTPLADRLHVFSLQNETCITQIYQILNLINRGEAKALVTDEVQIRAA